MQRISSPIGKLFREELIDRFSEFRLTATDLKSILGRDVFELVFIHVF